MQTITSVNLTCTDHCSIWSDTSKGNNYYKQPVKNIFKGYSPRITASRHLIGKDSFIISLAVSISLMEGLQMKFGLTIQQDFIAGIIFCRF